MEDFNNFQGQRTGLASNCEGFAVGVQHGLSPQIELRPEMAYYHNDNGDGFDGNGNHGVAANQNQEVILSGDAFVHF